MNLANLCEKTDDFECSVKDGKTSYVIWWDTYSSDKDFFDDPELYLSFAPIAAELFRKNALYYTLSKDTLFGTCCLLAGVRSHIHESTGSFITTNYANIKIKKKIDNIKITEIELAKYFNIIVAFLNAYFSQKEHKKNSNNINLPF